MKKLLSLILTVLMVMSLSVSAALVVSADNSTSADSSLIFSMDLSDSTVKNGVSGNSSTVSAGTGNTIGTVETTGTKYLDIGSTAPTAGVTVTDSAINTAASSAITLEWWAKSDSATPSGWMASLRNDATNKYNFKAQPINSSGVTWRMETEYVNSEHKYVAYGIPSTKYSDYDKWTHFAVTRSYNTSTSAGTIKVYLNGNYLGETTFSGTQYEMEKLYIGKAHSTTAAFAGDIGAFNVYNAVLDATAIKAKYDASREDYYKIDKTGLVFDMDLSGYDANSTDSAKGIVDRAADATIETLELASNAEVAPISEGSSVKALNLANGTKGGLKALDADVDAAASSNTMTVESWMNITSDNGHVLLYTNSSNAHNWQIMNDIGDPALKVVNKLHNDNSLKCTDSGITYNKWAHYVYTREYNTEARTCTLTLYVNGERVGVHVITGVTGPQTMSGGIMHIGGGTYATAAVAMNGSMATFKVYNRALNESEAYSKYCMEAGKFGINVDTKVMIGGAGVQWHTGNAPITNINVNITSVEADFSVQNNTNENESVFCILAMYDSDGNLIKYDISDTISLGGYSTDDFSLVLADITPSAGCYAKIFVWQGDTLRPYISDDNIINYSEVYL